MGTRAINILTRLFRCSRLLSLARHDFVHCLRYMHFSPLFHLHKHAALYRTIRQNKFNRIVAHEKKEVKRKRKRKCTIFFSLCRSDIYFVFFYFVFHQKACINHSIASVCVFDVLSSCNEIYSFACAVLITHSFQVLHFSISNSKNFNWPRLDCSVRCLCDCRKIFFMPIMNSMEKSIVSYT